MNCHSYKRTALFLLCLGWMGVASCTTVRGPETLDSPKPLSEARAPVRAPVSDEKKSPPLKQSEPLPDASELLMTQSDLLPRPAGSAEDSLGFESNGPVKRKGKLFSLSAQDAEIKTVLLALSNEIKQNIIIDPAINEIVTIDLKNVGLKEALDNLLTPLKLHYRLDGNFIHVNKRKMTTRMFRLNYIISRRSGASNLQSTSGQGTGGSNTLGGNTGNLGGVGAGGGNLSGSSTSGSGRTFTNLFTSEETDLWREIYFGLRRIVTNVEPGQDRPDIVQQNTGVGGGGIVTGGISGNANPESETGSDLPPSQEDEQHGFFSINRQAGIIIVKDYPEQLIKVAEFLEAIEGSAHRQVFILAKILEVQLRDEFKLGVDWSKVSPLSVVNEPAGANMLSTINPSNNVTRTGISSDGTVTTGSELGTVIQGSAGFLYGLSNTQIHILIDALGQQGNVSVLSSPKIATLNNQRAVIKVGTEDIFFIPQVVAGAVGTAPVTTFIPSTLTIGIVLDVLPQINADGEVMMSINTSITEKSGEKASPDGNSLPVVEVRESNNVVLARSGQTIVIGGLMKNKKTRDTNRLPFLGDIPLIGRLFQHEADVDDKTELVIMLTPQVMAGLAIDEKRREEEERLKKFMMPVRN